MDTLILAGSHARYLLELSSQSFGFSFGPQPTAVAALVHPKLRVLDIRNSTMMGVSSASGNPTTFIDHFPNIKHVFLCNKTSSLIPPEKHNVQYYIDYWVQCRNILGLIL